MNILYMLPFVAATLYGLNYAILGVALKSMSISTFLFYNLIVSSIITVAVIYFDRANLRTDLWQTEPRTLSLMACGMVAAWGAWMITTLVIKNVNPTYAAIGEIAYPVFVPIYSWLLFRDKQWDVSTVIGGVLIFAGLAVIIYGRMKAEAAA